MDPTQQDRGETSRMSSGVESGILSETLELSHAIGKMKVYSDKEFESAKKRFEEARKSATYAFCNQALNIYDRIFAAKLRAELNITAGQRTMTGQNCLLTVHFFTSTVILTGHIFIPFPRILNRFFSSAYDVIEILSEKNCIFHREYAISP